MSRISHVDYVRTVLKPFKNKIKKIYSDIRTSGLRFHSIDIQKISIDFLKYERRLYAIDHEMNVIHGKLFLVSRNPNNVSQQESLNKKKEDLLLEEKMIREYIADMNLMITLSV